MASTHKEQAAAFSKAFVFCFICALTLIVWHYKTANLDIHTADRGWTPNEFVNVKVHPKNFSHDTILTTIKTMEASMGYTAFLFLYEKYNIDPKEILSPYILLQTALLATALLFVANSIYNNKSKAVIFLFICFTSPMTSLELSRFSYGIASNIGPLYYATALGFLFFALYSHFKDNYIATFFFLAIGALLHITIALIFSAFIGTYLLLNPRSFTRRDVQAGLALFLLTVGWHVSSVLGTLPKETIPDEIWIPLMKIFSFHWFPSTVGIFTRNAHQRLFPLLAMAVLFPLCLRQASLPSSIKNKILAGTAACIIFVIVGYIGAEILPNSFIIKLCPLRASNLLSFTLSLFLVGWVCDRLLSGSAIDAFAGAWMLASMMTTAPGFPLAAILILLLNHSASPGARRWATGISIAVAPVAVVNILASLPQAPLHELAQGIQSHFWTPLTHINPGQRIDLLFLGGSIEHDLPLTYPLVLAAVIGLAAWGSSSMSRQGIWRSAIALGCVVLVVSLAIDYGAQEERWMRNRAPMAKALLDAQTWARDNTPQTSLFLVLPYRGTGWRDVAMRSSFGNLRRWNYTNIIYTNGWKTYEEGQRKMRAFGLDWRPLAEIDDESDMVFRRLEKQMMNKYHSMAAQDFLSLAQQFKIDYAVVDNRQQHPSLATLPVAHRNALLTVYRISPD